MANVSEQKKKIVEDIARLARQYPIIGVANMQDLPAPQLQSMKSELRGKIILFMTKKRLMKIALESIKGEKRRIEELEKYFEGMPALIFTNESPFRLSRTLQKSKTKAPAKAGQTAPEDIVIAKGPTPFAPGPVISELSSIGLKVGVEGGKVAVKEDAIVAKKGEKIKPKVAEILARLGITPMEAGLGLIAAYEDGIIYQKSILEVDEAEFNRKVSLAALQAFNLAFNIAYPAKDNIRLLIAKAFNDAKAIGISQKIFDRGIIECLLSQAEREMLGLKGSANIETKAAQAEEGQKQAEEQKAGEKKAEILIKGQIEKKEEKLLEEEKSIIEEEKELEEEKPGGAPAEKEAQEAVKEEEEKELEKERIDEEKELEELEKQKEEMNKAEEKKEHPKPQDEVDKKVNAMVKKIRKFAEGKEETAAGIIEDIKKEGQGERHKDAKEEAVPISHDLEKQKESKAQKEVEELTKELLRKGTLRKK